MAALPVSEWRDFFAMIGTASGAIVGASFVVATLTAGSEKRDLGIRGFITPTAVHLGVVLVSSAVLTLPVLTPFLFAICFGIIGAGGLVYAIIVIMRIHGAALDMADRFWYGASPILAYLATAGAAGWMMRDVTRALELLAAALVALLIIGMHNLWDMATFMILRNPRPDDTL